MHVLGLFWDAGVASTPRSWVLGRALESARIGPVAAARLWRHGLC